jgi:hypothetical protein
MDGAHARHKGVGKKSPYTVPFFLQVWAIAKRQTILKFQDKFGVYTGYGTSIVIALVVGSVYFQLPESASGAFTRGGLLFLGLLFNVSALPGIDGADSQALTSFSELPSQMMGRPILYRQVGYRFYRPAAFAVAAVLSDIPFNASNIVSRLGSRALIHPLTNSSCSRSSCTLWEACTAQRVSLRDGYRRPPMLTFRCFLHVLPLRFHQ